MTELDSYRWKTLKNGVGSVAIVTLKVEPNPKNKNLVREHYSGNGFTSQGYIEEVPHDGYESWKIAARKGLEFAFAQIDNFWTVDIMKIEGRSFTDTNPTVVGYTVMRAFFEKIGFKLEQELIDELEEFVERSWVKPYKELLPDFSSRTFEEYHIKNRASR